MTYKVTYSLWSHFFEIACRLKLKWLNQNIVIYFQKQ